jgi:hypothetical protein
VLIANGLKIMGILHKEKHIHIELNSFRQENRENQIEEHNKNRLYADAIVPDSPIQTKLQTKRTTTIFFTNQSLEIFC